jgi:hypothetical protein
VCRRLIKFEFDFFYIFLDNYCSKSKEMSESSATIATNFALVSPPGSPEKLITKPGSNQTTDPVHDHLTSELSPCSLPGATHFDHDQRPNNNNVKLIDIRGQTDRSNTADQLSDQILTALSTKSVAFPYSSSRHTSNPSQETLLLRSIPTLVLYDDAGLDIFDQITYIPEYYPTMAEIAILDGNGHDIIQNCVKDRGVLIELGVG